MVLPITGLWIAIIEFGIVLFAIGDESVLAAFFALVPLGFSAALFAMNKLPGVAYSATTRRESKVAHAKEKRDKSYYDDVFRRAKSGKSKRNYAKLFERSLEDDK